MTYLAALIVIGLLFFLLGKAASFIVNDVRILSTRFGISLFYVGLILGFFTSLPEFAIGMNAAFKGVSEISFGNLLGTPMVIFGLIFGLSLILHNNIKTDGKLSRIIPALAYIFLSFLFFMDGKIQFWESVTLIWGYAAVIYILYHQHKATSVEKTITISERSIMIHCARIVAGLVAVLFLSHLIVFLTEQVLYQCGISGFFIGFILFALGTNLPEVSIMFTAWKKGMAGLSTHHLIGSAITDPFLIGIFSFLQPVRLVHGPSFWNGMLFTLLVLVSVVYFYKTDHRFSRNEGFTILAMYVIFLISELTLVAVM